MNKKELSKLKQNLISQFNNQNDTVKHEFDEDYNYKLVESELDKIISLIDEKVETIDKVHSLIQKSS